jgi:hypothetical protein
LVFNYVKVVPGRSVDLDEPCGVFSRVAGSVHHAGRDKDDVIALEMPNLPRHLDVQAPREHDVYILSALVVVSGSRARVGRQVVDVNVNIAGRTLVLVDQADRLTTFAPQRAPRSLMQVGYKMAQIVHRIPLGRPAEL